MPKTTIPTQVTDGRAAPPVEVRRLFQLERSFDLVLVDSTRSAPQRVILRLPDCGARREEGPGVFRAGNVTLEIHSDGCCFARWPCSGPPTCISTRQPETLTLDELGARIGDLEYFQRTRTPDDSPDEPVYLQRLIELGDLRAEMAKRSPQEPVNA
jgi:hypothetical protein